MADEVLVLVTRTYPRHGTNYPAGSSITVPDHVARRMESARPPYGRRMTPAELDALTRPHAPEADPAPMDAAAAAESERSIEDELRSWLETD